MHKFKLSIILLSSILVTHKLNFTASKNNSKTVASAPTTKLADTNQNQIKRISGNKSTMSSIPTVLSHEVIKAAPQDAPAVKVGQMATVNYTGWLYDNTKADKKGAQFDSSKKPGRTPFKFKVGGNMVIAGWDKGLQKMHVGGTYLLTIPSDMGYGVHGHPPVIPGNAPLLFEIEVLSAS